MAARSATGDDTDGYKDAETLERLYWDEGLTQQEIGERFGVSARAVCYWMQHHDIDRRDSAAFPRKSYATYRVNNQGHPMWDDHVGGKRRVFVHQLLAVAEYGFDAVRDRRVVHSNGIPWDNRPENIQIMSDEAFGRWLALWRGEQVSRGDLIFDLRVGAEALGHAPSTTEVRRYGEHGMMTYYKLGETWDEVLDAAGIDPETGEVRGEIADYVGGDGA